MRRIIIMLLLACAATATVQAQSARKQQEKTPVNVIRELQLICSNYGQPNGQTYSLNKNPNTNIVESSERITRFTFKKNLDSDFRFVSNAFLKDESVCYQLLHITPGSTERFSLNVMTDNGQRNKTLNIRTKSNQEMWLMCSKNPYNPQLRDAYAIMWEEKADVIEGYVYMITSLRPDIYEKNLITSSKTFRIEGRVDAEIKDSLYNIYIADTYEELNNLANDDYIACVPVINKRFEYSIELDEPKAGRIRCIFPDGSLCSAWINLDMVPGETYRITVHNGYFDEDRDYEQRVGRYSGKSKIVGHENDDIIEDTTVYDNDVIADTCAHNDKESLVNKLVVPEDPEIDSFSNDEIIKLSKLSINKETTENYYQAIALQISKITRTGGIHKKWNYVDSFFKLIIKQNKEMDNLVEDIAEYCPSEHIVTFYKNILEYLTEQNKAFNELYTRMGHLSNEGAKCQKHLNSLTEKYMEKYKEHM